MKKIISCFNRISIPRAEEERVVIPKISREKGEILEVGCSTAIYRNIFSAPYNYTGFDLTDLEFPESDKNHRFIVGSGYQLPFKDKAFDFVFSLAVIEHVRYPKKFIKECSRVLKVGGKLLINGTCPIGMRYESSPKYSAFTYKELAKILDENGLVPIWHQYVGGPLAHLYSMIESIIVKMFLGKTSKFKESSVKKRWDPYINSEINSKILRIRGFLVNMLSSFELATGLVKIWPMGIHVLAKKVEKVCKK